MNWKDYKGEGPWSFVEQPNKWGYLNNPEWDDSDTQTNYDANPEDEPVVWPFTESVPKTQFNEGSEITTPDNPVWRTNKQQFGEAAITPTHVPCGYWNKHVVEEKIIVTPVTTVTTGTWRPAKNQFDPGQYPIMGNAFGSSYHGWIFFPAVQIPRGAVITSAIVTGTSMAGELPGTVNLKCYFNNVDNAAVPTSLAVAEALALTQAVKWDNVPTFGPYGVAQAVVFPSVKDILQTVINRTGWTKGNNLLFVVRDNSSAYSAARALENYYWALDLPPKLTVNFRNYGYR